MNGAATSKVAIRRERVVRFFMVYTPPRALTDTPVRASVVPRNGVINGVLQEYGIAIHASIRDTYGATIGRTTLAAGEFEGSAKSDTVVAGADTNVAQRMRFLMSGYGRVRSPADVPDARTA